MSEFEEARKRIETALNLLKNDDDLHPMMIYPLCVENSKEVIENISTELHSKKKTDMQER